MIPALWISKTGLDAQQTNISQISNNLANASTDGYKKGRAIFEDLLYQNVNQPGGQSSDNTTLPSGLMIGAGAKVVATQKDFGQGGVQTSSNPYDLMIDGNGFFSVQLPDGTTAYTRNGHFTRSADGILVTAGSGYPVQPEITIQAGATITVGTNGQVTETLGGATNNVGQITVTNFVNPTGLQPMGENLYLVTQASGDPIDGIAGLDGLGSIKQSSIETSNVNATEELVNLIQAQRVYEMNSKVISSVDQMLSNVTQQL